MSSCYCGILWLLAVLSSTVQNLVTGTKNYDEKAYNHDLSKEMPIPIYMNVFYFNCTNAQGQS